MHAFIIEDEYLIGQSLRDMLEQLGFTSFSFARSEDAAVMGATAQKIDLITADVRLLPGDGVRAVEDLQEASDPGRVDHWLRRGTAGPRAHRGRHSKAHRAKRTRRSRPQRTQGKARGTLTHEAVTRYDVRMTGTDIGVEL